MEMNLIPCTSTSNLLPTTVFKYSVYDSQTKELVYTAVAKNMDVLIDKMLGSRKLHTLYKYKGGVFHQNFNFSRININK